MTNKVYSALYRYFEALYYLNRNLIVMCGVDVVGNFGNYDKYMEDIIHVIPQLIPYEFNKSAKKYEICNQDGLLEFSKELPFLASDYHLIFENHYHLLKKIKKIRNKFEHELHLANIASSSRSLDLFEITYDIGNEDCTLLADDLIRLVKDINNTFAKIQREVDIFAHQYKRDEYPCYQHLMRYNFSDFNLILESDLLRIIGMAFFPF